MECKISRYCQIQKHRSKKYIYEGSGAGIFNKTFEKKVTYCNSENIPLSQGIVLRNYTSHVNYFEMNALLFSNFLTYRKFL